MEKRGTNLFLSSYGLTPGTAAHIYIYREPDDFLRHTYPIRFLRRRDPPCLLVPVPLVFPLFPRLIVQAGHVRNPLSDQENASLSHNPTPNRISGKGVRT